jgi:DNA modification methylase
VSDLALNRAIIGDCRETLPTLPDGAFQCCTTSPPYWGLRDYGHPDQLGLERTPDEYVERMVGVFREVRRVLRDDGVLWLNLGDSYAQPGAAQSFRNAPNQNSSGTADNKAPRCQIVRGHGLKPKDLVGIPWRVAFALRADGWFLRSDLIWHKPNPMPESVTDRPTKAHEYVFLLSKSASYYYDAAAIAEPAEMTPQRRLSARPLGNRRPSAEVEGGVVAVRREPGVDYSTRNCRSVWTIATTPYSGSHFAVMPPALVTRCILAGSRIGDAVLDPFLGSGTVGQVAESLGRRWLGCELNPEYGRLIGERTAQAGLPFAQPERAA